MDGSQETTQSPQVAYRLLPAVEVLLAAPQAAQACAELGREVVREHCRALLDDWRARIRDGLGARELALELEQGALAGDLQLRLARERGAGLRPAINATGVVLHTGLGRAPVHPEAAQAMAEVAGSFATAELDRWTGERNQRDARLAQLVRRATGAEAAICVNNCAAAVLLAINTFAHGREALLSRGEMVEIGGSFRMPDVMQKAGAKLVEVGTTNRTRLADYQNALTPETGLILKVHTSNYRVQGFTESTSNAQLAELGRESGLPVVYDLGSGLVDYAGARPLDMLGDEVDVPVALAEGVDAVLFSGDKLFGAPQAGFCAGRSAAIEAMRKNPLYRALRLDKVAIAGLERTLELALAGRADELPVRAMLAAEPAQLKARARELAAALDSDSLLVDVVPAESQPGSGAAPCVFLPTSAVAVTWRGHSAEQLARALRANDPPIFVRIHEGRVLLDPRTLLPGNAQAISAAFARL